MLMCDDEPIVVFGFSYLLRYILAGMLMDLQSDLNTSTDTANMLISTRFACLVCYMSGMLNELVAVHVFLFNLYCKKISYLFKIQSSYFYYPYCIAID